MGNRTVMWLLCCVLMTGALLFVEPATVSACSCAGPLPVQDELNRKTAVFAGKVKQVSKPAQGRIWSSADPVTITFEVTDVWKGEVQAETTVSTALSGASCGYEGFFVNQSYIVFAYGGDDGKLKTTSCDRTKPLSGASEELAVLGQGYAPSAPSGDAVNKAGQYFVAGFGLAVVVLASVIALAVWKRRRS